MANVGSPFYPTGRPTKASALDPWISKTYKILTKEEAIALHRVGVEVVLMPKTVTLDQSCLRKPLDLAFGDGVTASKMSDWVLKRAHDIGSQYDYAVEVED